MEDVFNSIYKKIKGNGFIQIITCLKWLLPVTLVSTKQSGLPLDQHFLILLRLIKSVKIIIMLNKFLFHYVS